MECRYAYRKEHIEYVLCGKEPEPNRFDREKLFHAVCAHQVDCPKRNCLQLSPGWERCAKLQEPKPEATEEDTASEPPKEAPEKARRKTATRNKNANKA